MSFEKDIFLFWYLLGMVIKFEVMKNRYALWWFESRERNNYVMPINHYILNRIQKLKKRGVRILLSFLSSVMSKKLDILFAVVYVWLSKCNHEYIFWRWLVVIGLYFCSMCSITFCAIILEIGVPMATAFTAPAIHRNVLPQRYYFNWIYDFWSLLIYLIVL